MRGWMLAGALTLATMAGSAFAQGVPVNPQDTSGLRKVGAEVLFWSQQKRDANFPHMEKIFPGHVVKAGGKQPTGYSDMRKLFEDKNVAGVSMPLPNHWHALATIWACQAGKDVYVEKPVSHTIEEGAEMVKAIEASKQIVQTGTQQRSWEHFMLGKQLIDAGKYISDYLGRKPNSRAATAILNKRSA